MAPIFHFKCTSKRRLQFVSIWTSLKLYRLVIGWDFTKSKALADDILIWVFTIRKKNPKLKAFADATTKVTQKLIFVLRMTDSIVSTRENVG